MVLSMLGGKWRSLPLGDVIKFQRGFDLPVQERMPGPYPIVSSSGISGYHNEARAKAPGVVTGRYGTIGAVYFITEDYWPHNTTLWVTDFKGNDPKFVSYLLRTFDFGAHSDKSSVPGINRNHLHMAVVSIPPLPEQRRIAHILGTLDDKIELNRRMNETLEQIARALFTEWFVDFGPVHAKAAGSTPHGMNPETAALFPSEFEDSELGEVPKGWRVMSLDEIAIFLNGLALQKFPPTAESWLPVIKIAQLRKGHTQDADRASGALKPEYIVHDGDVLFSWSGSLEVEIWCGGNGALNQHLFKVTSATNPKWFYYMWTRHYLARFQAIAAGKATTMGHIQRHHLTNARVLVPPMSLLTAMTPMIQPIIDMQINNRLESRQIAKTRDELLVELMGGGG